MIPAERLLMWKRIVSLIVAVGVLLAATTALAANWSNSTTTSPYSVAVIPVKRSTNVFGQDTYAQEYNSAAAGDSIYFAVRVDVPENPVAAQLTLKATNAIINAPTAATLPSAQGVYYLQESGGWSSSFVVLNGYCTGSPTVTAAIRGLAQLDSVGSYTIARSDGFVFLSDTGKGMAFYTDATDRVYSAKIILGGYCYGCRLDTVKLTGAVLADDSEAALIARQVFNALQMDASAVLAGQVYMSDELLDQNFGRNIATRYSKTWGVASTTTLATTAVTEVPATGVAGDLFVCGGILVMLVLALKIKKKE